MEYRRDADLSEDTDTLYNTWLEREYDRNPAIGENDRVSPSANYSEAGPGYPGCSATYGNSPIKPTPGYSWQERQESERGARMQQVRK
jgi:hypothetical protein